MNDGTPDVCRYFQISSFYNIGDEAILPDHCFFYAESKLIPSGHLIMTSKATGPERSRSFSPLKDSSSQSKISRSISPLKTPININFNLIPTTGVDVGIY